MAKRIIIAEAHADAPKPLRGVPDGSGYRDMARSESSAQELGRPADGKPTAGVGRLNKLTKGWGAFYSVGYPSKAFHAVNGYALHAPQKLCFGGDLAEGHPKGAQAGARMARFLNRKSQRRYRLKFADTYYGELNHYGMHWLKLNIRGLSPWLHDSQVESGEVVGSRKA